MNNDDKILKILESIDNRVELQGKDIADVKQAQAHTNTAIKALATKQDLDVVKTELKTDIKKVKAEMATKADILDLDAKLVKKVQSHERRINTLEDEQGIPHPNKN